LLVAARHHLLFFLIALTAATIKAGPVRADAERIVQTTIILSVNPGQSDSTYRALLKAAGNPVIEPLALTQSEAWTVNADKIHAIEILAKEKGVSTVVPSTKGDAATLPVSHDLTEQQQEMMSMAMESKAATKFCVISLPDPRVMEYVLTRRQHQSGDRSALIITLRADFQVIALRTSVQNIENGYAWHGNIKASGEPVTLIWRVDGELAGQIYYEGHRFVIRHLGGEKFAMVEMIPRLMPSEHPPMAQMPMDKIPDQDTRALKGELNTSPSEKRRIDNEPLRNLEDAAPNNGQRVNLAFNIPIPSASQKPTNQIVIDVLVPYTAKAAEHYVNIKHELIELAIEEANQSFLNSGVTNVRLRLVHSYQTSYIETGATHFDHVFRLADKGDGYMDEVHAIRDAYHADVVVLIVDDPNGCGLSAGVAPKPDRAFAVVHHECAATSYSLAHEIGHILGARHDVGLDNASIPYAFGHGFIYGKKWRTVMSYAESCDGCPRLPIWSNPDVKVGGVAAGNAISDNARVISEGAIRVSRFR
jgi:hypothetical protein